MALGGLPNDLPLMGYPRFAWDSARRLIIVAGSSLSAFVVRKTMDHHVSAALETLMHNLSHRNQPVLQFGTSFAFAPATGQSRRGCEPITAEAIQNRPLPTIKAL